MTTTVDKQAEALQKKLGVTNVHQIPRVMKVTVTSGVGKNRDNKQFMEGVRRDLALITGQQPHERRARKAIAGFNVRENNIVGYRTTLRGKRAQDFVTRFVSITLPRVRDFRGIPVSSIDEQGNLSVGVTEHLAFPEIHAEKTDALFGVQATFTTSAPDRATAEVLFRELGFPFTDASSDDEPQLDIRQGKK